MGQVIGNDKSLAAIDICGGYRGYIKIGEDGYILQPLIGYYDLNSKTTPHTLEKLSGLVENMELSKDFEKKNGRRKKRSMSNNNKEWNGYYLGEFWSSRQRSEEVVASREFNQRPPPSEVKKLVLIFVDNVSDC